MPSSKNYKRDYKQERRTKIKREATKSDPKATRTTVERNKKRKALGLKVGDKRQAGHTGSGKLAKTGPRAAKAQSARSNQAEGGRKGSTKGKAAGGRKGGKRPSVRRGGKKG